MMMSSRCCHHVEVRSCRFQVRVWQCVTVCYYAIQITTSVHSS